MNRPHILITHNDLDGAGCAVVFRKVMGDKDIKIYHEGYDTIDSRIRSVFEDHHPFTITLADISPVSSEAIALLDTAAKFIDVKLYDHHKTAVDVLKGYRWAHMDVTRCGTQLLFEAIGMKYDLLKPLVDTINDYDMWIHSDKNSMRLNTLFRSFGMDRFVERCVCEPKPEFISANERLIIDIFEQKDEYYAAKAIDKAEVLCSPYGSVLVVMAEQCQSLIGERIRDRGIEVDFAAIIDLHNRKVSLRSVRKGFDVGEIAKQYGGGGHHASAGYEIEYNAVQSLVEVVMP